MNDDDLRRLETVGAHAEIPAGMVLIERVSSAPACT
jgi:hypothetical protein